LCESEHFGILATKSKLSSAVSRTSPEGGNKMTDQPTALAAAGAARLSGVGALVLLFGALLAHFTQTSGGIRIVDVRFTDGAGTPMSALLYVPPTATPKTPAPGVLAIHGYFNSREAQSGFAIEFARRGYVTLALDQRGHGYSAPPAFAAGFGGPAGLSYLRSLDIVDKENIGLEGHSMGGWAVLNAAAAFPDGYKAVVLEGSSTGPPFSPEGSPEFPRNLAVVFSTHDEFSQFMWGTPTAQGIAGGEKLRKAFGSSAAIQPGKVYGSIDDGTARVLFTPPGTHPQDHLSREAIGDSIYWFQRTLSGGHPLPPDNQIWPWKELGTLIAFVGFVVLLLGVFDVLLRQPYFAPLVAPLPVTTGVRDVRWWVTLAVGTALPALTFLPFMQLAEAIAPASRLLPQGFTNQIVVWAVLNAAIVVVLSFLPGAGKARFSIRVRQSILIALFTVGVGYGVLAACDALFEIDLRFWFVGLKLMSRSQFAAFLVYLVPFVVFFVLILRGLHSAIPPRSSSRAAPYIVNIVALTGGFVIFLIFQYAMLFTTGKLPTLFPNDTLRTIVAIQFVPLMLIVAVITTFTYQRTQSYLPGALTCALFVTWYVVAGQATHVAS
jgi:pimeloyl-ACP methyl ester carboxylesterase